MRFALSALLPAAILAQTVVFENVNVIPMDRERVLQRQTVVVRDGRIAAVGRNAAIPAGAVRIDGRGKFLMPGLAEMHGHLPPPNTPREVAENILFLYIANGVTTVRGMLGDSRHLDVKREIAEGKLLGPRLYVAGPAFSGNSATSVEKARAMVREQKAAGFDHLKIQEGLKPEVYDAIVAEARAAGIPFAGHVPNEVGVRKAIEARQISIDHLDNYIDAIEGANKLDPKQIDELAKLTRDRGVWTVPTMALWEVFNGIETVDAMLQRPELKYMPKATVEGWAGAVRKMSAGIDKQTAATTIEFRRRMLGALHRAGARIALGTDSPQIFSVPGYSIHREMPIMVASGMKPYDVLASGTRNVAEYYGLLKESGTVEPGKRADLLLLDGDPLANVANVARRAGVVVNGRWLPAAELDARLAKIAIP